MITRYLAIPKKAGYPDFRTQITLSVAEYMRSESDGKNDTEQAKIVEWIRKRYTFLDLHNKNVEIPERLARKKIRAFLTRMGNRQMQHGQPSNVSRRSYKVIPKKAKYPKFNDMVKATCEKFLKADTNKIEIIEWILQRYSFIDSEDGTEISTYAAKNKIRNAFSCVKYREMSSKGAKNDHENDVEVVNHREEESAKDYEDDSEDNKEDDEEEDGDIDDEEEEGDIDDDDEEDGDIDDEEEDGDIDDEEEEDRKPPSVVSSSIQNSEEYEEGPPSAKRLKSERMPVPIKQEDETEDVIVIDDDDDDDSKVSDVARAADSFRTSQVSYQTVADAEAALAKEEWKAHLALADAEAQLAHARYHSKQHRMELASAKMALDAANGAYDAANAQAQQSYFAFQEAQYKAHRLRHDLHRTLHAQKALVHRLKAQVQAQREEG